MHPHYRKHILPILPALVFCFLACAGSVPARAAIVPFTPDVQPRFASAAPAFTRVVDPVLTTAGTARGDVAYISRIGGMDVYFRWGGVSYVFYRGGPSDPRRTAAVASDEDFGGHEAYRADVSFPGSNPAVRLEALDESGDLIRAYREGSRQRTLNSFSRLIYREIYRNIDLVYRFADGTLKYDFIVRPGGNPCDIRIAYEGAGAPARLADGSVLLVTPFGELREQPPVVFTLPDGASTDETIPARVLVGEERFSEVAAAFDIADGELRFRIGEYDRSRTLVIDPGLLWSSYYGGGGEDWGYAIAVDAAGNAYFTGATLSASFPVQAAQQTAIAGNYDAFLVKMGSNGQRIWATYFGGSDLDYGFGVAADGASVALCGWTRSANFPVLNAAQPASGGDIDAFAARFDSSGVLLWSTFCGGSGEDRASDIAADGAGNLVLTGWTFSSDFPLVNETQAVNRGVSDVIVVKYSPAGALLLSTYRGGTGGDEGWDVDADGGGNIHIALCLFRRLLGHRTS